MDRTGREHKKQIPSIVGMLAHVDAGKTTLTEGLLFESGAITTRGRVDHGTAFLDTNPMEKARGITIYSKEARFSYENIDFTLMDTPGHMDFSPEMERTLGILDYAVLVISGSDGVQSHTETLWNLLEKHKIPTVFFVNKMDLPDLEQKTLLATLRSRLSSGCVDFTGAGEVFLEDITLGSEELLEEYLETGEVVPSHIQDAVKRREIFPCFFGSALNLEGIPLFLQRLSSLIKEKPPISKTFSGKVFKITRDPQGTRLTHVKVTGGNLGVRDVLEGGEKVTEIRFYSGEKYSSEQSVGCGTVCALGGLQNTKAGDVFGSQEEIPSPLLSPVLTFGLELPQDCDQIVLLKQLKQLQEEDPSLAVEWLSQKKAIQVQMMGDVQIEVLKAVILQRFGVEVEFSERAIIYRETLSMTHKEQPIIGVGHYEPLRHYAEVVLELSPLPPDSGLQLGVNAPTLPPQYQHLVLSHLGERIHRGVLTGSPLTDMKITVIGGRAHEKHTEGGDFREATFRALRQGLMQARSVLLEPWVSMEFILPTGNVGRAMSDVGRMGGTVSTPETVDKESSTLSATAPLVQLGNYHSTVLSYTGGRGVLRTALLGYRPCENTASVVAKMGYDPLKDPENPAESIFCKHGAGYGVRWEEVHETCHCALPKPPEEEPEEVVKVHRQRVSSYANQLAEDKDLMEIFQRTYGKIDTDKLHRHQSGFGYEETASSRKETKKSVPNLKPSSPKITTDFAKNWAKQKEYLLVDGYNIIFAWGELEEAAREELDYARQLLLNKLCNYQAFYRCEVIVVFDAYKVKGGAGSVQPYHNITQVFTKEAESADMYIEKVTHQIATHYKVRVATSDAVEQRIILGHGALRVSAQGFYEEMERMNQAMRKFLS